MASVYWVFRLLKKCNLVISDNVKRVLKEIDECMDAGVGNSRSITLIGASKSQTIEKIREAYKAGLRHFGENYLQEAEEKIINLELNPTWHFIGAIQSRKAKKISQLFDWVHTVDSYKVAEKLNDSRPSSMNPLNICVQLNIDNEETKSGVSPDELESFIGELQYLNNLIVRGLMVIPMQRDDEYEQRKVFKKVKDIYYNLVNKGYDLDTLSMGMSSDFAAAIKEGATMIRVGTSIFGLRE